MWLSVSMVIDSVFKYLIIAEGGQQEFRRGHGAQ
jgi:hypothetical protein